MADESAHHSELREGELPPTGKDDSSTGGRSEKDPKHWLDYANLMVSVFVLGVAALGFLLTWSQIRGAAAQIEGAALYQVARDGRELMRDQRDGNAQPSDVLSYFHSAYLLHRRGVIDEEGWKPLRKAYCYFIQSSKPGVEYLEMYRAHYDDDFNTFSRPFEEGEACE